jgi:predicted PurR-regulated permease PerM
MDKHISISYGTFVRAIVVGTIAYAIWVLHSLVLLVLTAIVIASAIEPGVVFLVRYKIHRVAAVILMYLTVFGSLFSALFFFLPPILQDAQGMVSTIPQYVENFALPTTFSDFTHLGTGAEGAKGKESSLMDSLFSLQPAFTYSTQGALKILAAFFGGIFSFVLIAVLSFYFAIQETGVEQFLRLVIPPQHEEYVVSLWLRARIKIGLWMQGQMLSSLIGGVLAYLGLLILGVPYALTLSLFTAAAMLVPIFGSFLSAIPAVAIAFSAEGTTLALIVAGLYFIINQFEAHIIHPLVVNKVVGIPPLLVILALIVGGELAGFLGVLLAIPFAAALREFISDYDKEKRMSYIKK